MPLRANCVPQPSVKISIIDPSIHLAFHNMSQQPPYSFSNEMPWGHESWILLYYDLRSGFDFVFVALSLVQTCPKPFSMDICGLVSVPKKIMFSFIN